MKRWWALGLVVGLLAAGCHKAAPTATGYASGAPASAAPVTNVGGVMAPQFDPGPNPGHVEGQLPFRDKTKLRGSTVVEIRDPDGRLVTRAKTTSSGAFNVDLPPGEYVLNASVPGHRHHFTTSIQVSGGQTQAADFKPEAEPPGAQ